MAEQENRRVEKDRVPTMPRAQDSAIPAQQIAEIGCGMCPTFSKLVPYTTQEELRNRYESVMMAHNMLEHGMKGFTCAENPNNISQNT